MAEDAFDVAVTDALRPVIQRQAGVRTAPEIQPAHSATCVDSSTLALLRTASVSNNSFF